MKNIRRRFEVTFPLQFNDGQLVPDDLLTTAVMEVVAKFAGASYQPQAIEGHWVHEGVYYRDNNVKLIVDVPDTLSNRDWMKKYKARWKRRFDQIEIWMVSYRIEIE